MEALVADARKRMAQYDSLPHEFREIMTAVNDPVLTVILYQLGASTFDDAEKMLAKHGTASLLSMAGYKMPRGPTKADTPPENRLYRTRRR